MKKILLGAACLFGAAMTQAQLVNNGATIVVQQGATLFCAGSLTNTSGTITNDGKIEVQGHFANSGTYNSTVLDDSLIMSGAGSATFNGGGATFRYLTINKAANSDLVTLTNSLFIGNKLDYLAGTLTTDYLANPSYAVIAPASAEFAFAAGREIVGNVQRTGWSNGATVAFNGEHMRVATNGGTAPSSFMVTMLPGSFGGDPTQAEREVKRKFLFAPTAGSGFTTDIRFPYLTSELNTNTEANLLPWSLISSEWNARTAPVNRDGSSDWVSTTGIDATALSQEWKLADPRYTFNVTANFRGPWNGTDMNANITGIIPAAQPYGAAPFNYTGSENAGAISNPNIVDWVLVELRKPASGLPSDANSASIIGRKAGFLLRNGSIVEADGTSPLAFDIAKQGASFIAVRHRNHLGVLSNIVPSNAVGTFANNFTTLANVYKNPSATSDPVVLMAGGAYGLWSGDANGTNNTVNSIDVNSVESAISNLMSGYVRQDINLNGAVNSIDVNQLKTTISNLGQSSLQRVNAGAKSSLPD